jgi:predicted regulator of Ras-like GTPase activity (Roadblock/LC7/MglB family)
MPRMNDPKLQWLLRRLLGETGATHAVVASTDGIALGSSAEATTLDDNDELAALTAAVVSLSEGVSDKFHTGGLRQTIIQFEDAFAVLCMAGELSCLAVRAPGTADVRRVTQATNMLVIQVKEHLDTSARNGTGNPDASTSAR